MRYRQNEWQKAPHARFILTLYRQRMTAAFPAGEDRLTRWAFAAITVISVLAIGTVIVFDVTGFQDATSSAADLAAVGDVPPYAGFLSQAGVLVWAFGAAVCWWSFLTLTVDRARRTFLLSGAVVTSVMMVDDVYMLHDWVLPAVGIPENLVLAALALLGVWFVWANRRLLLQTSWPMLVAAVLGLGTMLVVDLLEHSTSIPGHIVYEEGAKFFGLLAWCTYLGLSILPWALSQPRVGAQPERADHRH